MQTELATLPREGPSAAEAPNHTGLAPGSDASLRRATEKLSTKTACVVASANVARNHAWNSGKRSETIAISLVEAGASLSHRRLDTAVADDKALYHNAGSSGVFSERQWRLGMAQVTCPFGTGNKQTTGTPTTG